MVRRALVLIAALGGLVLGACNSSAAPGASGGASSPQQGVVEVKAREFAFEPSSITVPAGETTFRITNVGQEEHEFEIFEGDTVIDEVEGIVPGLTRELTVDLEAGDYTYVCKLAGHEEAGMKGMLTVTGS